MGWCVLSPLFLCFISDAYDVARFDDNHPMGAEADALMDDALGLNKWFKDPQPAASSSTRTFQRIERPEAEWDSTKWRKSNLRESVRVSCTPSDRRLHSAAG